MQSPWIKLSDRLPTEAECPSGRVLVHCIGGHKSDEFLNWGVRSPALEEAVDHPNYDYWMPIPLLPSDEVTSDSVIKTDEQIAREAAEEYVHKFTSSAQAHVDLLTKIILTAIQAANQQRNEDTAQLIVTLRQALVRASYPKCPCGANTACDEPHDRDCFVEPLVADTPQNRSVLDAARGVQPAAKSLPLCGDPICTATNCQPAAKEEGAPAAEQRSRQLRAIAAAYHMDWGQVVCHQGNPCFYVEESGHFCGRAETWVGHQDNDPHVFVSLPSLLLSMCAPSPAQEEPRTAADLFNGHPRRSSMAQIHCRRRSSGPTGEATVDSAEAPGSA